MCGCVSTTWLGEPYLSPMVNGHRPIGEGREHVGPRKGTESGQMYLRHAKAGYFLWVVIKSIVDLPLVIAI